MKLTDGHRDVSHWLSVVEENVRTLRFGVVQIVVHDAKVVQVERTEKIRLDDGRSAPIKKTSAVEGRP